MNVLYVEDEDENWHVAELLLKRSYEMVRAKNDREACAAVVARHSELDAILMDIQLHGSYLDGIKLTRLFRGTLSAAEMPSFARAVPRVSVPILFVTAYQGFYKESELIAVGGNRLIPKPVDFIQLAATLSDLRMARPPTPA